MPQKYPPNPVQKVPADPDPDAGQSYSSSSTPSDSSDYKYSKRRQHTKNNKNKRGSKFIFEPIKKYANLTAKLITAANKAKIIEFKCDEDPLQRWVYFLSFMNSLNFYTSQFKEIYILLMEYLSIRR